jgi:hypothetical protein
MANICKCFDIFGIYLKGRAGELQKNWVTQATLPPYPLQFGFRPVALRPTFSSGLPLSNNILMYLDS